jgi:peptidyl-prolyl cis-trans isomerase C
LLVAVAFVAALPACRKTPVASAQTASAQTPATAPQPGAQPPAAQAPAEPAKPVPAVLPDVVARVNGEAVQKADLERMLRNMEMRVGQPIPADRRDEIVRKAVDQLVTYTLLAQESRNRHVEVADAEVDTRIGELRGKFPDENAFNKALADRGSSVDQLKKDARNELSISKMMDAELASEPAVTDQDARAFYDGNPDKFQQQEAVRASHILIRVDEKADPAAKQKARTEIEAVLKQLKDGAYFATVAREHSQDGSAAQGGDLNYFTRGQMVPAFEQAAFALQTGQMSGIVESPFGYHIIKVTDRKPARTIPYEEVTGRIKEFLSAQHKQQHADTFIQGLRSKAKIEVLI